MNQLSKVGDLCMTCYPMWVHQKLEPKKLQGIYDANGKVVVTHFKGLPIVACPYCDGELIFSIHKDKDVTSDDRRGESE